MISHIDLSKAIFYTPEEQQKLREKRAFQAIRAQNPPKQADLPKFRPTWKQIGEDANLTPTQRIWKARRKRWAAWKAKNKYG